MKQIGLIFPNDLSTNNKVLSSIKSSDPLLLYEPCDTFYQLKHHKHKLVLLISALRHWKKILEDDFTNIIHIKITKDRDIDLMHELETLHKKLEFNLLHVTQPSDHGILTQLMFFGSKHNVELKIHPDTKFIDSIEGFSEWSADKKSLVQEYYYRWLRKKYSLLMEGNKPLGGKWNFDKDNQKSISKLKDLPKPRPKLKSDELTISTMVDIENCFPDSAGNLESFNWAVTHSDARKQLKNFLMTYFKSFGDFQDAIDKENTTLFHSLLSPYINSGLLDPMECIVDAISYFKKTEDEIPINALEGFVRQILGWRESGSHRLSVFKSLNHIYVQVITPSGDKVIKTISSNQKNLKAKVKSNNIEGSKIIGKVVAEFLKKEKINKIAFDRSGYKYHGKIKALAESIRENGVNI